MIKGIWGNESISIQEVIRCNDPEPELEESTVIVTGGNIYFYSDITSKSILNLNKEIKILENNYIQEQIQRNQSFISPINLYIMSSGGEIVSSLSAMDTILKCRAPINTIVDGNCASAATFLSIVGKRRYIKRNSFMMIHQLSAGALGKYNEVKDDIRNIEQLMRIMKDIYSKYTKVPTRKLNEVLKHDLWWKADVCLKYGLVDEIL
jgi:ATP-dependent Clp endopeptidase proteolytic subunit ClpP